MVALYVAVMVISWSERGTVNPEVVGSIPGNTQLKIYMNLCYLDPQTRVLTDYYK